MAAAPTCALAQADASRVADRVAQRHVIVRRDDGGMSRGVDLAPERLIATGIPLSVSVMFPTPRHQETADSLRRHPDAAVGVHLTLPHTNRNRHGAPTALTSARFGDHLRAHDVK